MASSSPGRERGLFFGTAALFVFALLVGGLGPHAPLLQAVIEAAAFPLLVAIAIFARDRLGARAGAALLLLLALLAVGLFQLAPIPAGIWRGLPGRDVPGLVFDMLGQAALAHPFSVAPEDTRLTVQAWLPPIAVFAAVAVASRDQRTILARLVLGVAMFSCALALAQLSFGDGTAFLYPTPPFDRFPGLFANSNHQAVFLAGAVALLPAAAPTRAPGRIWGVAALWVVMMLAVVITASRAGLILFVVASALSAVRIFLGSRRGRPATIAPWLWIVAAAVLAIAALAVAGGYWTDLMTSRFGAVGQDLRYDFWSNSIAAIRAYFPYGSGFGTFEPAYQVIEPIESVRSYVVNHAHNDYLEIVLEAGVAGILLIAAFIMWFALGVLRLSRTRSGTALGWSGATIVVLVMLHSAVDYPLRTEAIGCLFAYACALMVDPARTVSMALHPERRVRQRAVA